MSIGKRPEQRRSTNHTASANAKISRAIIVSMCLLVAAAALTIVPKRMAEASSSPQKQELLNHRLSSSQSTDRSDDGIWTRIDENSIERGGERQIIPDSYLTLKLNKEALMRLLSEAPIEFSGAARERRTVIALPMPDGTFQRFRIVESPIMAPELAAKFPEIKTYKGQGIDDPTATTRFDLTPHGFHAIVLSSDKTVYVDPYAKGDTRNYITYNKRDARREGAPFECLVKDESFVSGDNASPPEEEVANGTTLKTYRLALAATGEYTAFHGGTVPLGQAAIVTAMNRVNAIYEREVAVRMVLVANNSNVVYTNAGTDPYTNTNGVTMLGQNQTNLDAVIGTANYDIGHVFSTGGGGVATLNSPCNGATKARGVTGSGNPTGDGFWVDYVAHEMGHQYGGRHTFNGTTANCGGGNRTATAAYEPGSGSTIMGYAGICGTEDLQSNSDDYFHVKSLEEIVAFITVGGACAANPATGNTLPTVAAGADFNIPAQTPFTLTAAGVDNDGDALTYCWEQYDLGAAAPPNTDDGARPIFRSYLPNDIEGRTFPKLQYILNNANTPPATYACPTGTCLTGERLPTTTRNMTFQVTARDNRVDGGGIITDTMEVNVTNTGAPFAVTQPNTPVIWPGGSTQTVTWNVAGTTGAPINTANVNILFSTDGGLTFAIALQANTPNDGSEPVLIPSIATGTARIRVEAAGNIYFDVSDTNFSISGPACDSNPISIPPSGMASPYASAIIVSGLPNPISATPGTVRVTLKNFTHSLPDDVGIVLVGPTGVSLMLQDGAGDAPISNLTYTFSDTGATLLPNTGTWTSGTYRPSMYYVGDSFPAPGPGTSYNEPGPAGGGTATLSSTFAGTNPNGTWRLYIFDFTGPAGGNIAGGWCLAIGAPTAAGADLGGRVTMASGLPLSDVNMTLLNTGNSTITTLVTGADGRYQFPGVETGMDYLVTASRSGYTFNPANQFVTHIGERTDIDFVATQARSTVCDFDGDGKTDISVFRPSTGVWYMLRSSDQGMAAQHFGIETDRAVPGDYDGDSKADVAVFRQGTWYVLQSSNGIFRSFQFGQSGDVPVPADFDGDGTWDFAVFRQGVWYIWQSSNNSMRVDQFGLSTDKPVVADYDGDGNADPAVFRNGDWYLLQSTSGFRAQQFGVASDTIVRGDYDGDSRADVAVFRDGVWLISRSVDGGVTNISFGLGTDRPAAGDYDGDGKTDIAVFRPSDATWYLLQSNGNTERSVQWGSASDLPLPSAYIP